ncbi:hypothetical protein HZA97_08795 [Candidatus Woesearchaeota archaeon]|nr:hypothetical protein [Candidatus Woesearchaeota archaeon]
MKSTINPPIKKNFNIDNLIKDFERDSGFFVVLLGVEWEKEQVSKYQFAIFDSSFYGTRAKPEILFHSKKYEEGPLFMWDGLYVVDFNIGNNFCYTTFECDEKINKIEYFKEYYTELRTRMIEEFGWDGPPETVEQTVERTLEQNKDFIEEISQEVDSNQFLMRSGRMGKQLAQARIRLDELENCLLQEEGKELPSFRLMQKLFPTETLKDYLPTDRNLVLPEHKKWVLLDSF